MKPSIPDELIHAVKDLLAVFVIVTVVMFTFGYVAGRFF